MTKAERIETMIEAFRDFYDIPRDGHSFDAMVNALDAADVEGMVRKAIKLASAGGYVPKYSTDEIVRRVCG